VVYFVEDVIRSVDESFTIRAYMNRPMGAQSDNPSGKFGSRGASSISPNFRVQPNSSLGGLIHCNVVLSIADGHMQLKGAGIIFGECTARPPYASSSDTQVLLDRVKPTPVSVNIDSIGGFESAFVGQRHHNLFGHIFEDLKSLPGKKDFFLVGNTPKGSVKVKIVGCSPIGLLGGDWYTMPMKVALLASRVVFMFSLGFQ